MQHRESEEQQALFRWAKLSEGRLPELKLLHHIPNGGKRNPREAARLKLEGVRSGVPDISLPVARGRYHGMYIEMKADKGRLSENQIEWMDRLRRQGYLVALCHGWEEAAKIIEKYLVCTSEFKGQEWA
jgi:hypothetical protein